MTAPDHDPDDAEHFADCIDCHRTRYGRPGMTAGEFAPFLPEHLRSLYWRQKIGEVAAQEDTPPAPVPETQET